MQMRLVLAIILIICVVDAARIRHRLRSGEEAGATTYTVKSGDTCWAISQTFKVTLAALEAANPGKCDNLQIGAKLTIPGGSSPAPTPSPTPTPTPTPSGTITFTQFQKAVTSNGFSTPTQAQYNAFISQYKSAGGITSNRELAMFLAEILHESGGLRYKSEIACTPPNSCGGSYDWNGKYQFYGRGYIQLTWAANYKAASQALFGDARLYNNPTTVATDESQAWGTAFWFWKANVHPNSGVQAGQFGSATKIINGGLECGASRQNPTGAQTRFNYYGNVFKAFGITGTPNSAGC